MNLFDLKEIAGKLRFIPDRIRYARKKHLNLTFLVFLLILVIIFGIIFSFQKAEIKRKENILKSYYSQEPGTENTGQGPGTFISAENNPEEKDKMEEEIQVHICGEVAAPGVYKVEPGARVNDLVEMAGGATESAVLSAVNLAQELSDGQKIYIPSLDEVSKGGLWPDGYQGGFQGSGQAGGSNLLININTAGIESLQSLPGIGPAIAGNIIEYREKHGSFSAIEELERVDGIGPKKYEKIRDLITV